MIPQQAAEASTHDESCFHCGLPLDPDFDDTTRVLGKARTFCCPGCLAVTRAIVDAGLEAYYEHRREKAITADAVPEIVRKLGFYDHPDVQQSFVRTQGQTSEASLLLENIRCAACLWLNERVLRGLDGVVDVDLDYASHHARVRWDPDRIQLSEILESVANIGYIAHPYDSTRREELVHLQRRRSTERLIFAGVIGMMVMQFALAGYAMGYSDETGELALWVVIGRWTSLFATTTLLAYPGQEFFIGAWRDLRNRRLGMDVPIVLGLGFAYVGSLYTTVVQSGEVYYDSIAMFVFLVLLARRIELKGRTRAADALDRVGRIVPRLATRLEPNGETREVLVTELRPGDQVRILPGELVPTDGRLVDGASSFDESLLTGESVPVARLTGEPVIGGACNIDQPVVIEVDRDSSDSTIAEIQRLLARGVRDAPRYAILAQRVASWFVGAVLIIAAATAATWLMLDPAAALPNTIAVLIVTCPCALALATPVAAAIAVGRFADNGVMTVRSDAIEALAQCDVFVFDKTGTLTNGELRVAEVVPFGDLDRTAALAIAAALEAQSEHPISRALRNAGMAGRLSATDIENRVGEGLLGLVDGRGWRIGKPDFALNDVARQHASVDFDALLDVGQLVIALGDDRGNGALISLVDHPRDGATEMLQQLRDHGVARTVVLSGDHQTSVDRFTANLAFDEAHGDMSPADKLKWIHAQQALGSKVAMVGDGVNDAPTLASADVSISFADATELAQVSSSMLLLGADLRQIGLARKLAGDTRRIIRQNLSWAASYNLLAVPAAAAGLIAPWGAAIGMSLSSLLVIINALRLRERPPTQTTAPV